MTAVAFLGLGTMGYPMAGHLQREGYHVCVYNRSSAKALRWVEEYAGRYADTPREACAGAELVFCCVGNDDDLRAVALGEQGAFAGMAPGSLFVDHTTASAEVARELSLLAAERELGFRRAGLRRPGGRGQRRPDGDGRWRGGLLSTRRTAAAQLCADGPANGRRG